MSEIERILRTGGSETDATVGAVTQADLRRASAALDFDLPASYCEFVALGGLAELRINHRVLSPAQFVEALSLVEREQVVPFADNGCGDLYCWRKGPAPEPEVVLADHEDGQYSHDAASFVDWLRRNRF